MTDEEFGQRMAAELVRYTKAEAVAAGRKREIEAAIGNTAGAAARHSMERQLEAVDAELAELGKRITATKAGRVRYDSIDHRDMLEPAYRNALIMEAGRRGVADRIT
jgi:hypothetical protein